MYVLRCNDHYCELVHYAKSSKEKLEKDKKERLYRMESASRAKNQIIDYVLNNDFNYLMTITFDKRKQDRYDYQLLKKRVTKWLNNYRTRYDPGLKYVLTAEKHKKKSFEDKAALHFHVIVKMKKDTKLMHYLPGESKKRSNEDFSVRVWRHKLLTKSFGKMNELVELYYKQEFVAFYVSKYITKGNDMILDQYYYASKNLKKSNVLCRTKTLLPPKSEVYSNQYVTKYRIEFNDLYDFIEYNRQYGNDILMY